MRKLEAARAQLGTALDLFIRDRDPISVHVLASGAAEVLDALADRAGIFRMSTHILDTVPDITMQEIRGLRNQHWNAFKHATTRDGLDRQDDDLMGRFGDELNDTILFVGWFDFMSLTKTIPVEAQVFQVWWFAANPAKVSHQIDYDAGFAFPGLTDQPRFEQKRRLARAIEKYRKNTNLMADVRTERAPLCARTAYLPENGT